jgi:hypothetical protein
MQAGGHGNRSGWTSETLSVPRTWLRFALSAERRELLYVDPHAMRARLQVVVVSYVTRSLGGFGFVLQNQEDVCDRTVALFCISHDEGTGAVTPRLPPRRGSTELRLGVELALAESSKRRSEDRRGDLKRAFPGVPRGSLDLPTRRGCAIGWRGSLQYVHPSQAAYC